MFLQPFIQHKSINKTSKNFDEDTIREETSNQDLQSSLPDESTTSLHIESSTQTSSANSCPSIDVNPAIPSPVSSAGSSTSQYLHFRSSLPDESTTSLHIESSTQSSSANSCPSIDVNPAIPSPVSSAGSSTSQYLHFRSSLPDESTTSLHIESSTQSSSANSCPSKDVNPAIPSPLPSAGSSTSQYTYFRESTSKFPSVFVEAPSERRFSRIPNQSSFTFLATPTKLTSVSLKPFKNQSEVKPTTISQSRAPKSLEIEKPHAFHSSITHVPSQIGDTIDNPSPVSISPPKGQILRYLAEPHVFHRGIIENPSQDNDTFGNLLHEQNFQSSDISSPQSRASKLRKIEKPRVFHSSITHVPSKIGDTIDNPPRVSISPPERPILRYLAEPHVFHRGIIENPSQDNDTIGNQLHEQNFQSSDISFPQSRASKLRKIEKPRVFHSSITHVPSQIGDTIDNPPRVSISPPERPILRYLAEPHVFHRGIIENPSQDNDTIGNQLHEQNFQSSDISFPQSRASKLRKIEKPRVFHSSITHVPSQIGDTIDNPPRVSISPPERPILRYLAEPHVFHRGIIENPSQDNDTIGNQLHEQNFQSSDISFPQSRASKLRKIEKPRVFHSSITHVPSQIGDTIDNPPRVSISPPERPILRYLAEPHVFHRGIIENPSQDNDTIGNQLHEQNFQSSDISFPQSRASKLRKIEKPRVFHSSITHVPSQIGDTIDNPPRVSISPPERPILRYLAEPHVFHRGIIENPSQDNDTIGNQLHEQNFQSSDISFSQSRTSKSRNIAEPLVYRQPLDNVLSQIDNINDISLHDINPRIITESSRQKKNPIPPPKKRPEKQFNKNSRKMGTTVPSFDKFAEKKEGEN
ncbi:uncharacterized protein LOC122500406 isoform X2 [Leptopilina heterotoma]|nr:uncharacterized protein LOC122500406 isoform X2 [Leptopilina heterotoma]